MAGKLFAFESGIPKYIYSVLVSVFEYVAFHDEKRTQVYQRCGFLCLMHHVFRLMCAVVGLLCARCKNDLHQYGHAHYAAIASLNVQE